MESKDVSAEGRTERKKKETRQKIVNVALDLFQRQGFGNTTMEQIAEETDIARKTLYNHFSVKEAIVDEYVKGISRQGAHETLETLRSLPNTRLRLQYTFDKLYEWVEINPEIIGISLGYRLKNMYQGAGYSGGGSQSLIEEIIRLGRQAGEIRQDIPAKLLVKQLDTLRMTVVLDWLNDTSGLELRKEMAKLVDLFLTGAMAREDGSN
ncbi:TetR/AcrR family transcriptional regulator [Desulfosporosinus sp. PR]|uniref:TetR/AcrR family transcriptional regulator n=1 Tax=Candidatus Desulfosporosinus nitrosoreducens TaxID=3401928 RepID=UPI0027E7A2BA|nr:TetR/AcrR family transcriptional regulator [Desulfosporosinus sp. PR]MDQ7092863.1 TetR/AcrR family transcriptional regulator [Desulfosporosinus sp. PR]